MIHALYSRTFVAHVVIASAILVFFVALPVLAQTNCVPSAGKLCNPSRFPSIIEFIQGFLRAVVMLAIPVITFFIVLAGFYFVWARGNPGQLAKARENFLYVIIGAALILGAWTLATLIGGTVTSLLRG